MPRKATTATLIPQQQPANAIPEDEEQDNDLDEHHYPLFQDYQPNQTKNPKKPAFMLIDRINPRGESVKEDPDIDAEFIRKAYGPGIYKCRLVNAKMQWITGAKLLDTEEGRTPPVSATPSVQTPNAARREIEYEAQNFHDQRIKTLKADHRQQLDEEREQHRLHLETVRAEKDLAMKEAQQRHEQEMARAQQLHEQRMAADRERYDRDRDLERERMRADKDQSQNVLATILQSSQASQNMMIQLFSQSKSENSPIETLRLGFEMAKQNEPPAVDAMGHVSEIMKSATSLIKSPPEQPPQRQQPPQQRQQPPSQSQAQPTPEQSQKVKTVVQHAMGVDAETLEMLGSIVNGLKESGVDPKAVIKDLFEGKKLIIEKSEWEELEDLASENDEVDSEETEKTPHAATETHSVRNTGSPNGTRPGAAPVVENPRVHGAPAAQGQTR